MRIIIAILLLSVFICTPLYAEEGYDDKTGSYIHPVSASGDTLEYYDDEDGTFHSGEVMEKGEGTEEIYDYKTGEYRYLDTTD